MKQFKKSLIIASLTLPLTTQATYLDSGFNSLQKFSVKNAESKSLSVKYDSSSIDLNSPECQDFINFSHKDKFSENDMNTFGVAVLKDGKPIFESYNHGINEKNKIKLWSISKTVTTLMYGALVKNNPNDYSLDTKVAPFLTPHKVNANMTLKHLLTNSSGISWCELGDCGAADSLTMAYTDTREKPITFIMSQKQDAEPGDKYNYSSAGFTLAQRVMKKIYKDSDDYFKLPNLLFGPMGITNYSFETVGQGSEKVFAGGFGVSLGLRDFATLGLLIQNKGYLNGKSIVDSNYIENEMLQTNSALCSSKTPALVKKYEGDTGMGIWLNKKNTCEGKVDEFFPAPVPNDLAYAAGKFGQFLISFPEQKLVVARIGGDPSHSKFWNPFAQRFLNCFDPKIKKQIADHNKTNPKVKWPVDPVASSSGGVTSEFAVGALKAVNRNFLVNMKAMESCNCLNITGLADAKQCELLQPDFINLPLLKVKEIQSYKDAQNESLKNVKAILELKLNERAAGVLRESVATYNTQNPIQGCGFTKYADSFVTPVLMPKQGN